MIWYLCWQVTEDGPQWAMTPRIHTFVLFSPRLNLGGSTGKQLWIFQAKSWETLWLCSLDAFILWILPLESRYCSVGSLCHKERTCTSTLAKSWRWATVSLGTMWVNYLAIMNPVEPSDGSYLHGWLPFARYVSPQAKSTCWVQSTHRTMRNKVNLVLSHQVLCRFLHSSVDNWTRVNHLYWLSNWACFSETLTHWIVCLPFIFLIKALSSLRKETGPYLIFSILDPSIQPGICVNE